MKVLPHSKGVPVSAPTSMISELSINAVVCLPLSLSHHPTTTTTTTMPTTTTVGTSSAANQKLGGIPHIHYFDFFSRGRGQVIRLLCEDAGIAYADTRYTFDEFPSHKDGKLGDMNPLKAVPVVELNGKILTQSYAILRSWSRQLGEYDGKTEEERYFVDAVGDLGADCKSSFSVLGLVVPGSLSLMCSPISYLVLDFQLTLLS